VIREAVRTLGALVIATAVVAWALVGRREAKVQRRPRTGPLR